MSGRAMAEAAAVIRTRLSRNRRPAERSDRGRASEVREVEPGRARSADWTFPVPGFTLHEVSSAAPSYSATRAQVTKTLMFRSLSASLNQAMYHPCVFPALDIA